MIQKLITTTASALLILAFVACGDDADTESVSEATVATTAQVPTRADFVAAAAALCEPVVTARGDLAAEYFPSPTDPPTVEQLQGFYAAFAPVFSQMVTDFADLEPAPEDQAAFDAVVPVTQHVAEVVTEAGTDLALTQELFDTDEAQLHEPDAALVALGVPANC
jgi:hypothetical protein